MGDSELERIRERGHRSKRARPPWQTGILADYFEFRKGRYTSEKDGEASSVTTRVVVKI